MSPSKPKLPTHHHRRRRIHTPHLDASHTSHSLQTDITTRRVSTNANPKKICASNKYYLLGAGSSSGIRKRVLSSCYKIAALVVRNCRSL
jgi:hypothetical protein